MWPSAIITLPQCKAADTDSDNQPLYPKSPWGLSKPPLVKFVCLDTIIVIGRMEIITWFIILRLRWEQGGGGHDHWTTGNRKLISVFGSPEETGKRVTFPKLRYLQKGWPLPGKHFQPAPFQNSPQNPKWENCLNLSSAFSPNKFLFLISPALVAFLSSSRGPVAPHSEAGPVTPL